MRRPATSRHRARVASTPSIAALVLLLPIAAVSLGKAVGDDAAPPVAGSTGPARDPAASVDARRAEPQLSATLSGHGGPVHAIATAGPDRVYTASFDNSVGVWSLGAAAPPRWFEGHAAAVKTVVALADGVASAGDDFTAIVWTRDGRVRHRLEGHRGSVEDLAVSPDGTLLASAGWDGRVGLWSLDDGALVRWIEGHDGAVSAVAFVGNGEMATASADGTVRLFGVEAGSPGRVLVRHGFAVNRLVVDPDGRWLAYGAVDGGTRVVSLVDGSSLADLTLGRRPILALALSADGRHVAVGDGEGHVMVVETDGWRIAHDARIAARGPIWALAFAGDRLIAGGIDDAVAIVPIAGPAEPVLGRTERSFLRPAGTMENGERQFMRKCSVCHTLTGDGDRRAGPTLANVFGRRAGAVSGYNYSETLADSTLVWSEETLDDLFEAGPEHYVPGSNMPMQRIVSEADRRDLIEYMKTHSGEQ